MKGDRNGQVRTLVLLLLAVTAGFFYLGGGAVAEKEAPDTGGAVIREPLEVSEEVLSLESAFIRVADAVKPAVVNISTTRRVQARDPFEGFFDDPFFRRFFGERQPRPPRERETRAAGSGVIVSPDGYVLTNLHVIQDATDINLKLIDGREFSAEKVGKDDRTDLALLKIEGTNLPYAIFGDSERLRVGQWVMAIGNPFGLEGTVTVGVVSAEGRQIGLADIEGFIQTDASINPGNSGGPLVNLRGEVIGINVAMVQGGQGLGFAIPSSRAHDVFEQIRDVGRVIRGWLGVIIQPVTGEIAEALGLEEARGVLVSEILEETPAEAAGIEPGDIILKVNGEEIDTVARLQGMIASVTPGEEAILKISRDKEEIILAVKIEEQPTDPTAAREPGEHSWRGITATAVTGEMKEELGLPDTSGVLVRVVEPDSPAAGRIPPGAVITGLLRQPVGGLDDFRRLTGEITGESPALVHFRYRGRMQFSVVPAP